MPQADLPAVAALQALQAGPPLAETIRNNFVSVRALAELGQASVIVSKLVSLFEKQSDCEASKYARCF